MRCVWGNCDKERYEETRLVELSYEERFIIANALGLLEYACATIGDLKHYADVSDLCCIFCEENWMPNDLPNTPKVRKIAKENEQ